MAPEQTLLRLESLLCDPKVNEALSPDARGPTSEVDDSAIIGAVSRSAAPPNTSLAYNNIHGLKSQRNSFVDSGFDQI
jgi:hypothetical protein